MAMEVGPEPQAHIEKAGLFFMKTTVVGADDLLCFPKRPNGTPLLLMQTQGFFTRLLKGDLILQNSPPADVVSAQKDLKKLYFAQLLFLRCTCFDSHFTQSSHQSFLQSLKECLIAKIAERLCSGGAVPGMEAGGESALVDRVILIMGAHGKLPNLESDWWSFTLGGGGQRLYLQVSKLSLSCTAPDCPVYCYDASQTTHEALRWFVFLVQDAEQWAKDKSPSKCRNLFGGRSPRTVSVKPEALDRTQRLETESGSEWETESDDETNVLPSSQTTKSEKVSNVPPNTEKDETISLRDELSKLRTELEILKDSNTRLRDEKHCTTETAVVLQEKIQQLQNENQESNAKLSNLREKNEQLLVLEKEYCASQGALASLQNDNLRLSEENQKLHDIQQKVEGLEMANQRLEWEKEKLLEQNVVLQDEIKELKDEQTMATLTLSNLREQNQQLLVSEQKNRECNEAMTSLQDDNHRLREEMLKLHEIQQKVAGLEEANQGLELDKEKLLEKSNSLQDEIEGLKDERTNSVVKLDSLREQNQQLLVLEQEYRETKEMITSLQCDNHRLLEENKKLHETEQRVVELGEANLKLELEKEKLLEAEHKRIDLQKENQRLQDKIWRLREIETKFETLQEENRKLVSESRRLIVAGQKGSASPNHTGVPLGFCTSVQSDEGDASKQTNDLNVASRQWAHAETMNLQTHDDQGLAEVPLRKKTDRDHGYESDGSFVSLDSCDAESNGND